MELSNMYYKEHAMLTRYEKKKYNIIRRKIMTLEASAQTESGVAEEEKKSSSTNDDGDKNEDDGSEYDPAEEESTDEEEEDCTDDDEETALHPVDINVLKRPNDDDAEQEYDMLASADRYGGGIVITPVMVISEMNVALPSGDGGKSKRRKLRGDRLQTASTTRSKEEGEKTNDAEGKKEEPVKKEEFNPADRNPCLHMYSKAERNYFLHLSKEDKKRIAHTEQSLRSINVGKTPMRFKILNSDLDSKMKAIAIKKLENLSHMNETSGEYNKICNWLDGFVQIPFGVYKGIPLLQQSSSHRDPTEISRFLTSTKTILDRSVYGHNETKDQMIRFLAQWISNPRSKGSVIGIHGKPGVGKTTLVKEGICKALDMPFASIPLGGANDGSYLEGHGYTYEGSVWGKIVDVIMKAGCMNPVIYFDELDKVSQTLKGEEIINILIHLTDPSQNDRFSDKYFTDVPIDLSKCIIIFTYNDDEAVNPILKDRIIRINVKDYTPSDKVEIAKRHLVPSLEQQFNFAPSHVTWSDAALRSVIRDIQEEAGVRGYRRALEFIYSTLNLRRLLGNDMGSEGYYDYMSCVPSELPVNLCEDMVRQLMRKFNSINNAKDMNPSLHRMYV
jgi:ATP-dependent Lon protease